jgi:hypothetical protein
MATFSKQILSGSISGTPIALTSTSNMIHQTNNTSGQIDEVWMWATNINPVSGSVNITVTVGPVAGTAATASFMSVYTGAGLTPVLPGILLTPSGSTRLEVRAFTNSPGSSNLVNVTGYVNRIS